MKSTGILFDYNGVIVDDEHLQQQAMAEVVGEYGVVLDDQLYAQVCLGRTDRAAFQQLRDTFDRLEGVSTEELVREKVRRYERIVGESSILYPGIRETLIRLSESCLLGVVTGSVRREVEPILTNGGLRELFQCLITADDIKRGKPDPEGYLNGVAVLQLPKERVVVIEDTPTGIRAAKNAGLKCIAVEHTVAADQLAQADKIVAKVTDLTPELVAMVIQ